MNGANVLFNVVLNDQSINISYNSATGVFTLNGNGNYYVSWWVATSGAGASSTVSFDAVFNGSSIVRSSSPVVTGQVNGSALITVGAVPATFSLANSTGQTVTYANTPVQANIVILETAL